MASSLFRHGACSDYARDCIDHILKLKTVEEVPPAMEGITHDLGYRHFAIIHHTDLRIPRPGVLNINNYPPDIRDPFIEDQLFRVDPMIQACFHTCVGFLWSKVSRLIFLNHVHREIVRRTAHVGLAEGVTIPVSTTGKLSGSCSFGGPRKGRITQDQFLASQLIGTFMFEAARRLESGHSSGLPPRPMLSKRQRECTVLAGQGKKDRAIADALGIRYRTAVNHLDAARRRYQVPTREQLIISAVLDGDISLAELDTRRW